MAHHSSTIAEYRTLTAREKALLIWMLVHGKPEAKQYYNQIDRLHVVGRCSCGCPTIDLGTENQIKPNTGISEIIADAEGQSPEGVPVGVIVHVRNDILSELEIYSLDRQGNFQLPDPSMLKSYYEMNT